MSVKSCGRPPRYKNPAQMQKKIDEYFESCRGEAAVNKNGEQIFNKSGEPIMLGEKPPTVTGLALALGFTSRQALLNYQAKPAFVDTITRAKSRCEEYAETRLYDRDGARGAMFSLTNNFKGWSNNPASEEESDALKKARELLEGIGSVIQ